MLLFTFACRNANSTICYRENRYEVTVLSLASLIFATFILQGLAK
jgi:hypothetical protein